jgi:hypothetical protein
LAAIVKAARRADDVLHFFVATVFASRQVGGDERVVAAAHIALGFTGFLLWNGVLCHVVLLPLKTPLQAAVSAREYSTYAAKRKDHIDSMTRKSLAT